MLFKMVSYCSINILVRNTKQTPEKVCSLSSPCPSPTPTLREGFAYKWRHYEPEIILLCVRWYITYPLFYRQVAEMVTERGLDVHHTTVFRWVQQYAPELDKRCRPHLRLTNAWRRYPVVFFSPGHGATPKQYSSQLEQLASHGYVVVGINPTYKTPVLLPEGRVVTQSPIFNFSSANKQTEHRIFVQATLIRAKDISFVLNKLGHINVKDPQGLFNERLDLNQVGVFGHSLGGSTAVEAMRLERRIKAGISMDGGEYGELFKLASKERLDCPFMVMSQEKQEFHNRLLYQRLRNDAYSLMIKGSKHNTFGDYGLTLPLFSAYSTQKEPPIKQTLGSIEPQRGAKIINAYTLAFFNKYLKNQDSPLLKGAASEYPEVVLKSQRKVSTSAACKSALKAQQSNLSLRLK